jgi:IPT/TIG domain-containing protein
LKAVLANRCAEDRWSAAALTCFGGASNDEQMRQCQYKHLSQEQKDKVERAILPIMQSVGPRGDSRADIAAVTVKKYAFEAFPQWSAAHPDKACPDRLTDLDEYMNGSPTKDPWGRDYRMLCGATLPAGARGLGVVSAGEDGKIDTADDIKSWDAPDEPRLGVTGVDPDKGDAEGGTYVRIQGTRFIADGPRSAKVYFGARPGTIIRFASDRELIVQAPGGKANEMVDVLIIFDPGGQLKISNGFTFVEKH